MTVTIGKQFQVFIPKLRLKLSRVTVKLLQV